MSGHDQPPSPYSREGSHNDGWYAGPGQNRFDTRADGRTVQEPWAELDSDPQTQPWGVPNHTSSGSVETGPTELTVELPAHRFPTYPYEAVAARAARRARSGHPGRTVPEPPFNPYAGPVAGSPSRPNPYAEPVVLAPAWPNRYPTQRPRRYAGPGRGYAPPQYAPLAGAALGLGLTSILIGLIAPAALAVGLAALHQINSDPLRYRGRGSAWTGIALGGCMCAFGLLFLVSLIFGLAS